MAWWARYGLPVLVLIAAVITVGLLFPEFGVGNIGEPRHVDPI